MTYRYIDLAAALPRRHKVRRWTALIAFAVVAGLAIGGFLRAANADDTPAVVGTAHPPCPKGSYADFWSGDIPAHTKANKKLPPEQSKQFVARLNASKATDGKAIPVDGTTVRLLTHKQTGRHFGLALDPNGCVLAFGFIDEDFLAYLMGKGPMPERYQLPGEQI